MRHHFTHETMSSFTHTPYHVIILHRYLALMEAAMEDRKKEGYF